MMIYQFDGNAIMIYDITNNDKYITTILKIICMPWYQFIPYIVSIDTTTDIIYLNMKIMTNIKYTRTTVQCSERPLTKPRWEKKDLGLL